MHAAAASDTLRPQSGQTIKDIGYTPFRVRESLRMPNASFCNGRSSTMRAERASEDARLQQAS
jgi:hypothetical protein